MGEAAVVMQEYLGDAYRFADLFNVVFFQGKQVIEPQMLSEQSERYAVHPPKPQGHPGGRRGDRRKRPVNGKHREEYRDVKKRMEDGTMFRILAVEAQSYVDYTMPLRCMEYDVQEYLKQLRELRSRYTGTAELRNAERLSGIRKQDRLVPVYTLCLYHGEDTWDGPLCLADMMNLEEETVRTRLPFADYPMKLYCINEEDDFDRFRTDLREVFQALACRGDRQRLEQLISSDPAYRRLPADTAAVMAVLMGFWELTENMEYYVTIEESGEERYDMCKALMDLRAEERSIGQEIGQKIGQKIGEQIGQHIGQQIGEQIGATGKTVQIVRNMITRGYKNEDICAIAECGEELVQEIREESHDI